MQSFQIVKPSPELSPYIHHYWILQDDATTTVSERTLPVGSVQLVFHKGRRLLSLKEGDLQPRSFICGQSVGFTDVMSTGRIEMITVVLQPYAAKAFLHLPANLFFGQNVPMDEMEDKGYASLANHIADTVDNRKCICLIERFLLQRLYTFPEYNLERMNAVLHEINSHPLADISQLSEVACLSNKQFRRIFTDYIGATPKDFMRIVRMQRALYLLQQNTTVSFAQLAYECGFADQSHMIKEFRLFSGYTPLEYLSICAPYSDYFSEL